MKKAILFFFLLIVAFFPQRLPAVPAYPGAIDFKQPDGYVLTIKLFGDEYFHWAETIDGYTIVFNDKGFYEYAQKNIQGDLIASGITAKNESDRNAADFDFLSGINKKLEFSPEQIGILRQMRQVYIKEKGMLFEREKAFPTTGTRNLICILIGFTDLSFTKTKSDVNSLFNQVGYNLDGATGSVKDYYLENSWGQLTLNTTIAGPYTASNTMAYYGGNDTNGDDLRPRELVTEAINLANPDVNFANFDNDNDGTVDSVYVIYAGYGEEAGASPNAIWAHKWQLATPVTVDGKTASLYSCSSELRSNSGSGLTRIGVICHEFGHVLGAPDYYDTNYSTGGSFTGTGSWDLMASGSWNSSGASPAHHNSFTKWYYFNWFTPTLLSSNQSVTVQNIVTSKSAYYYNSPSTNEYWFLENRQKTGFDAALPGHGLIIYHVDQDGVDSRDSSNTINASHPQYMYPVCAGATGNPTSTPSSYGPINSGATPFPGTNAKTQFSSATTPAAIDWDGIPSTSSLSNISESSGVITFNYAHGTPPPPLQNILSEGFEGGNVPPTGWTLTSQSTFTWSTATASPHSGSYYAECPWDTTLAPQDEILMSPQLSGYTSATLEFWSMGSVYWGVTPMNNYDIEVWLINGAWGGGDDVLLGKAEDFWTDNYIWAKGSYDLSPHLSGQPFKIAFRYKGTDGAAGYLDDIKITVPPSSQSKSVLPGVMLLLLEE